MVMTGCGVSPWSDVENDGLALSPGALDMEDHLKGDPGAVSLSARRGMSSRAAPTTAFNFLMEVLLRDRLDCSHECRRRCHRKAEPGFQGGWRHLDKHAIGDGLRAGVTKR